MLAQVQPLAGQCIEERAGNRTNDTKGAERPPWVQRRDCFVSDHSCGEWQAAAIAFGPVGNALVPRDPFRSDQTMKWEVRNGL